MDGTVPAGMKVEHIRLWLGQGNIINVEIYGAEVFAALVSQHHFGAGFKGHGDIAIKTVPLRVGKQGRLERYRPPQRGTKEIAERDIHSRFGLPVPIDAQPQGAQHGGTAVDNGEPHALDNTRAVYLQQGFTFAGAEPFECIALGAIVGFAARAFLAVEVLEAADMRLSAFGHGIEVLGERSGCYK